MKDVHFVLYRLSIQTPSTLYTEQFKGLVTNYREEGYNTGGGM